MGRKSKHITELSTADQKALRKGYTYGKSPLYRRKCHSILLSHSGKTVSEIAKIYEVTVHSVREWLKQWEKEGLEGLQLKPGRGRKPKLDVNKDKHVQTVKTLVSNEPKNLRKVNAQLKEELDIEVSKKTLKRFLKNLNSDGNAFEGG